MTRAPELLPCPLCAGECKFWGRAATRRPHGRGGGESIVKRIPIKAAQRIADEYGYDQVMIYARKVGEDPAPHGEHMTTYGVTKEHCNAMARIAKFLQTKILGWEAEPIRRPTGGE